MQRQVFENHESFPTSWILFKTESLKMLISVVRKERIELLLQMCTEHPNEEVVKELNLT